ncbi:DUF4386 family protein [Saccharopolyspora sp. TS4A08]|uniref:DUF4386 family protein n=1 Tax=Saccharopolyspora ipomoeae TaxID=3042027 RepID=A0ABT6PQH2_9PSEU|nr:DUF4386 family protein [Saccharopolyspora sp. TS4A08]MDI2030254.1 DUF4386 family protein [Saccharopolyspora sp. TS4A08]
MNERIWERLGAGSGLLAAVALLVGMLLVPMPVGLAEDPLAIATYFAEHRVAIQIAVLLVSLGAVVALWFVAHLRHVLQRAEGGEEAFAPVVLLAGASLAVAALFAMVPAAVLAVLTTRTASLNGPAVLTLYTLHQQAGGAIGLLIALFAATAGAAMVRREITGPWLGWVGVLVAVLGLAAAISVFFDAGMLMTVLMFAAGLAFVLWIGAVSVVMVTRPEVDRARAARTVFAH